MSERDGGRPGAANGRAGQANGAADQAVAESSIRVLANRNFLLLWLSQLATQVGGNMVLYGLTILIFNASGQSKSAISLLLLSFLVPAVIFGAIAGVFVDRFDRRKVLSVTSLLRACFYLSLVFFNANVGVILLLNVMVSISSTFFAPAELSMIPLLVPRGQLMAANGVFTLTLNAAFAIGYTLFGPLVTKVSSPSILIVIVAGLYFISAVICWTLPSAPPVRRDAATLHEAEEAVGSVVQQLRDGIAYVRQNRAASWALVYLGTAASIVGILGVLGPDFAVHLLGLAPADFVVVVLPLGFGVVAGVLLVNAIRTVVPRRRVIEIGLIALGVCLALITAAGPISEALQRLNKAQPVFDASALVSVLAVVVAIAVVAGMAYAAIAIPSQTELQEEIAEEVRGRVFGILNTLVSVGSFLPIILVGAISDAVGTGPVLLFSAALVSLVGVASVVARKPVTRAAGTHPEAPYSGPGLAGGAEVVGSAATRAAQEHATELASARESAAEAVRLAHQPWPLDEPGSPPRPGAEADEALGPSPDGK